MTEERKPLLKVVILGDGGVGKSCLMQRYVSNQFDESSFHTIGVEFLSKEVEISGRNYTLQIWDTAGQERFRSLRTPFYRGSDMCLLVCCVEDRRSLDNLTRWRNEFVDYADVGDPKSFPFAVLANKNDLPADKWELTEDDVRAWCEQAGGFPHLMSSAKTAHNVIEAFSLAVNAWSTREESSQPDYTTDSVDLSKVPRSALNRPCCSGS